MIIVLLGPPGAGKGTQSKTLAKELGLAHISTGDILRMNVAQGSELGKKAKEYMHKGALVPDELVTDMVASRIGEADTQKGFILDGYPRNVTQADLLEKILKAHNLNIDFVIDLDTSEKVIIQRLSGRLACKGCNSNFHITNMPPKKPMVCDNCGGSLYQREDDKEATIKNRLAVYHKESAPVIQYFQDKGTLHRLFADDEAGVVLKKIIELVR
jgi:adenylate kinase